MIYILTLLYSSYLGVLIRNFVHIKVISPVENFGFSVKGELKTDPNLINVKVSDTGTNLKDVEVDLPVIKTIFKADLSTAEQVNQISVTNIFLGPNWIRQFLLFMLFMIDWICFLVIFYDSASEFSLFARDVFLISVYLFAIGSLTFAILNSFSSSSKHHLGFLTIYHILVVVADLVWLVLIIWQIPTSSGSNFAKVLMLLGFYIFIRSLWAAAYNAIRNDKLPINESLCHAISLAFKPVFLLFAFNIDLFQHIN